MLETQKGPQTENRILAALPPEEQERITPHLQHVEMPTGKVLYDAGGRMEHVYFPINSMISLVSRMSDGGSIEVGVTGYEGMVGISLALGVDVAAHENMVQIHDGAYRMRASAFVSEFKRGGTFQRLLLRSIQSQLLQISQVVACNRLHLVEERLARWLLMSHDRCACDDLPLTQEFLALMLGVRRPGVSAVAAALQTEGLIKYSRGHIKIIDRPALEDYACECYGIIKVEFEESASVPWRESPAANALTSVRRRKE